jgi:hypothetical protein
VPNLPYILQIQGGYLFAICAAIASLDDKGVTRLPHVTKALF